VLALRLVLIPSVGQHLKCVSSETRDCPNDSGLHFLFVDNPFLVVPSSKNIPVRRPVIHDGF
jgi:hypothetical protein